MVQPAESPRIALIGLGSAGQVLLTALALAAGQESSVRLETIGAAHAAYERAMAAPVWGP
jgi:hypothetical protein